MLRCIGSKEEENRALRQAENQRKEQEMERLRIEAQELANKIDRQNLVHSGEVEQLNFKIRI